MGNPIFNLNDLSEDKIIVDVSYYDEINKEKLILYPNAKDIDALVESKIEIPIAEFLTYFLFHKKKIGTEGYRDYETISRKINTAIAYLDEAIRFNGKSIILPSATNSELPNEIVEHVGESIGLSVINRIHNLTEADWQPIKQFRGRGAKKTFDFEMASDGINNIQLETKGSAVVDNRRKSGSIYEHKHIIASKKVTMELSSDIYLERCLRYGTITAIDSRDDGILKCWLVDPPADNIDENPKKLKLIHRMKFLRGIISFISPRSQLASALSTRLNDITKLENPFELDGVELRRGNNEPFEYIPFDITGRHSSFLGTKSRISDGPAGGVLLQLSRNMLFLFGMREDLLILASKQNFRDILDYHFLSASVTKKVDCILGASRFKNFDLPDNIHEAAWKSDGYCGFSLKGRIHYSSGGYVIGFLPLYEH